MFLGRLDLGRAIENCEILSRIAYVGDALVDVNERRWIGARYILQIQKYLAICRSGVRHTIPQVIILTLRILKNIRPLLHMLTFKATQTLHNNVDQTL